MEYVDGLPIVDFCRKHELTVKARVELLLQVATVLAYAHQNLIVHRDIKSSNVLVTSDGRAKLVDFGLTKLLDIHASPAMTVEAGPMTPAYAAPEQFYNGAITASTDIYQFGVLCFVTLTARLPYRADPNDGLNWARAVTEQEPMTLAQAAGSEKDGEPHLRRQLTRDLDAIIRKGIAKEPIQRYRSMDALIADLEAFLDSRPIRARRAGPFYFIWRFVRRWRYAVVPAVGLVIAWGLTALVANRSILYWLQRSNGASVEVTRANAVSAFLTDLFQSPISARAPSAETSRSNSFWIAAKNIRKLLWLQRSRHDALIWNPLPAKRTWCSVTCLEDALPFRPQSMCCEPSPALIPTSLVIRCACWPGTFIYRAIPPQPSRYSQTAKHRYAKCPGLRRSANWSMFEATAVQSTRRWDNWSRLASNSSRPSHPHDSSSSTCCALRVFRSTWACCCVDGATQRRWMCCSRRSAPTTRGSARTIQ